MTLTLVRRIEDASGITLEFANETGSVNVTIRGMDAEQAAGFERGKQYQVTVTPA